MTSRRAEISRVSAYLAENDDASIVRGMTEGLPFVFESDDLYVSWREQVVSDVGAEPDEVFLVGSGSTGLSLNPNKAGRFFRRVGESRRPSDLDIAVVNEDLFVVGWEETSLADHDRRLGGTPEDRQHTRTGIYWGHVSGHRVPSGSEASRRVRQLVAAAGRYRPLRGHRPTFRIYRRIEDLRIYQLHSLRNLRRHLLLEEQENAS